jgi:hypothetical protein
MRQVTTDRRVEPRALTAALIDITDRHAPTPIRAVLEDLSPSGACVYVDRRFDVGAEVSLTVGDVTCTGSIAHRETCGEGFRIGVRFDDRWPETINRPIHWISPSRENHS